MAKRIFLSSPNYLPLSLLSPSRLKQDSDNARRENEHGFWNFLETQKRTKSDESNQDSGEIHKGAPAQDDRRTSNGADSRCCDALNESLHLPILCESTVVRRDQND